MTVFHELHIFHLMTTSSLVDAVGFHATKFSGFLQRSFHEFGMHDFIVSLPSHLPPPYECFEDEDGGPVDRHRFSVLPKFSIRLRYTWECEEPFGHHMQPDLTKPDEVPPDRYPDFRSQGLALQVP